MPKSESGSETRLAMAQIAVSSSEHPELLAGLRGAGALFGIVSEVTFQLFDGSSDVYAGMLRFAEDDNYTTYRQAHPPECPWSFQGSV